MMCYNLLPTLKLWDEIISVDCPPTLSQEWQTLNKAVLEGRVTNVSLLQMTLCFVCCQSLWPGEIQGKPMHRMLWLLF